MPFSSFCCRTLMVYKMRFCDKTKVLPVGVKGSSKCKKFPMGTHIIPGF